jgi:hypothetical protein
MNKKFISKIPELYLIAATIYYWILTSNLFNPIAIVLLAIFTYQLISKKATLGIVISSIFILLNLFMVLALISELSEFTNTNDDNYIQLLLFGSLFLGINLIMASIMLIKHLKTKIT